MFRTVFLDRDGVLIENRSDYIRDWSHVAILPMTVKALSGLHQKGFKIIVVTNQSAVGRGLMSFETAEEINHRLVSTIREEGGWLDAVYMCPHQPHDKCLCRKPLPGLLLRASREMSLDLSSSWMVGDAWSDLLAGQAAGVQGTIMVRTGRGAGQLRQAPPPEAGPYLISDNLFEACKTITEMTENRLTSPDSP